jgi:hypothetical protein
MRQGVALGAALLAAVLLPAAAPAGAADWRDMAGRWTLDPAQAAPPDTAIARGVKGMFFIARPIAKRRLHKYLDPKPEMRLALSADRDTLTLYWGSMHHYMVPDRGAYTSGSRDEGRLERLDLWALGVLESSNRSGEGTMTYKFVPRADGRRIELTLTIVSGKLNGPVSGRYVYVRE